LFPNATSTKSSLARAIRDGVRNTRWARNRRGCKRRSPTADCETEPQNASRAWSDWQSSPTNVSQTMSASAIVDPEPKNCVEHDSHGTPPGNREILGQSLAQIQCLQLAADRRKLRKC